MRRTLLRTNCTWWCQARFWAEHVHLHPNLAVAIHALKAAVGLARSALLDDAVVMHAAVHDLEPCRNAQGHLRVRAAAHADPRTTVALASAAATVAASAALASRKAAVTAAKALAVSSARALARPRSRTPPVRHRSRGTTPTSAASSNAPLGPSQASGVLAVPCDPARPGPSPILPSCVQGQRRTANSAAGRSRSRTPQTLRPSARPPSDPHAVQPTVRRRMHTPVRTSGTAATAIAIAAAIAPATGTAAAIAPAAAAAFSC